MMSMMVMLICLPLLLVMAYAEDGADEVAGNGNIKGEAMALSAEALSEICHTTEENSIMATKIVESGKCGNDATFSLDSNGHLVISGTGKIYNYKQGFTDLCPWGTGVKTAEIGEGITVIGNNAFYGCTKLTSISFPSTLTAINNYAFLNCTSLTGLRIPASVTSIGGYAFQKCNAIKTAGPLGGGYDYEFGWKEFIPAHAFNNCQNLTSIIIPDSVESIEENAFTNCLSLSDISFPKSLRKIGAGAFWGCENLTNIDLPETVMEIGEAAFKSCIHLNTISIPAGLKTIGDFAFRYCEELSHVYYDAYEGSMEHWKNNGWSTNDNGSFFNAEWHVKPVPPQWIICGNNAAYQFSQEKNDYFGYFIITVDGYGEIWESSIPWHGNVRHIVIKQGITSIPDDSFKGFELNSLWLPVSVHMIGKNAFFNNTPVAKLYYAGSKEQWQAVSIAEGNDSLFKADFVQMQGFCGAETVWHFDDETGVLSVEGTGEMTSHPWLDYQDKRSLINNVIISPGVESICCDAFEDCSGLTSVTISESVTSIGDKAFYNCIGLSSVVIPASVTNIGSNAFSCCSGLTRVTFTGDMPGIDPSAFCFVNTAVYYPAENPTYMELGQYGGTLMWMEDYSNAWLINYDANGGSMEKNKEAIAKGMTVTPPIPTRDGYLFLGWAESTETEQILCYPGDELMPESDMNLLARWKINFIPDCIIPAELRQLDDEALAGTSFAYVKMPEGLNKVGSKVFDGCVNLVAVYIPESVTDIAADTFDGAPDGIIILGKSGTTAERFASVHGFRFEVVS